MHRRRCKSEIIGKVFAGRIAWPFIVSRLMSSRKDLALAVHQRFVDRVFEFSMGEQWGGVRLGRFANQFGVGMCIEKAVDNWIDIFLRKDFTADVAFPIDTIDLAGDGSFLAEEYSRAVTAHFEFKEAPVSYVANTVGDVEAWSSARAIIRSGEPPDILKNSAY